MDNATYIARFFKVLCLLALAGCLVLLPYAWWWIAESGDVDVDGVTARQASGAFALFGSGVSQDFVDYKLRLYTAVKPDIITLGSSRVMQFRGRYFTKPYLNIGGTAGNLAVLRSTVDAMLKVHKPEAVVLGLDFWWFTTAWEPDPFKEEPPTSGSYVYSFETLKTPYAWLLTGKISLREFLAPLTRGFRADRYGIMAQRFNDGFASDGSWYYTADITGRQKPFDFQFADTLKQVRYGIKAFAPAPELSEAHLDAFAEIYCRLRSRGVDVFVFIPPLASRVLDVMQAEETRYPQLFGLRDALEARGIDVMDFTNPRRLGATDCEFVDGFHGGDVVYARILRRMADHYPGLLAYVDIQKLDRDVRDWSGRAMMPDSRVTTLPEVDFMHFQCVKKQQ